MKLNFRAFYPLLLPLAVLAFIWIAGDVLAVGGTSNESGSDGAYGLALSQGLYCDTRSLLEGYIGLIIGLILVAGGIWELVKGSSFKIPLIMILFGSMITAIPGLIEVTMEGFGGLLNETNLTSTTFRAPTCNSPEGHYPSDPSTGSTTSSDSSKEGGLDYSGRSI